MHPREYQSRLDLRSFFPSFLARVKKKAAATTPRMNQNPLVSAVIKMTRETSMRRATPRRDGEASGVPRREGCTENASGVTIVFGSLGVVAMPVGGPRDQRERRVRYSPAATPRSTDAHRIRLDLRRRPPFFLLNAVGPCCGARSVPGSPLGRAECLVLRLARRLAGRSSEPGVVASSTYSHSGQDATALCSVVRFGKTSPSPHSGQVRSAGSGLISAYRPLLERSIASAIWFTLRSDRQYNSLA